MSLAGQKKAMGWEDGDDDDDEGFHLFATMLTTQALAANCGQAHLLTRGASSRGCCRGRGASPAAKRAGKAAAAVSAALPAFRTQ